MLLKILRLIAAHFTLAAFALFCSAEAFAADAGSADYKLHAGDKIEVSVWKEMELQKTITISPDGKFSFPLAGDVVATGRTVSQIRTEIESRLKKYIPEPVVTVIVTGFDGNTAYVVGQVNKPGAIIMNPGINVLQALSVAGGGTPFAKLDSIIVIRGQSTGQQRVMNFRYGQVSEGRNLEQNIQLESGDVVVVP